MHISLAHNHPLLPIAVSLMLGILAGFSLPILHWPAYYVLAAFFGAVLTAFLAGKRPVLQSILIMACTMVFGLFLALWKQQAFQRFTYPKLSEPMEAVVASEPTEKAKTMAVDVLLCKNGRKLKGYFEKDERARQLKPGDGLLMDVRVERSVERLPNGFNYRRYMEGNGFSGQFYAKASRWQTKRVSLERLPRLTRSRLGFLSIRHKLLERYRLLGASDDRYSVLAAMTLGDKSALSAQIRDVYAVSGASHILALSGMHIGILYMLFSLLTFSRHRRHIWSQALIVAAVWAFALLTGLSTSVVRAALMVSIFAVFAVGFRFNSSLNLLCLSAIIILTQNPYSLFDIGFQLSFMAVLSILLFVPLMENRHATWAPPTEQPYYWRKAISGLANCLRVSVAAQLGVAPLLAYYFGRFSTYFLVTNLIVLPAAYLILYGSLLMLLVPWPPLSNSVIGIVDLLNNLLTRINRWPLASIEGLHPSVFQVLLCYAIIACLFLMLIIWQGRRPKKAIRWDI